MFYIEALTEKIFSRDIRIGVECLKTIELQLVVEFVAKNVVSGNVLYAKFLFEFLTQFLAFCSILSDSSIQ